MRLECEKLEECEATPELIRDCHKKSMREAMSEIFAAREAERAEWAAKGEPAISCRTDPPPSKADSGLAMPRKHGVELERGRPEIVVTLQFPPPTGWV